MNFHDSPENHHASVVRSYPKSWKSPGNSRHDKDDHSGKRHGDEQN